MGFIPPMRHIAVAPPRNDLANRSQPPQYMDPSVDAYEPVLPQWWLVLLFLAIIYGLATLVRGAEPAADLPAPKSLVATVDRIIDGDSFVTTAGQSVRIADVDSPERDQPFGPSATQTLASLIAHEQLTLVPTGQKTYGRDVCHVYVRLHTGKYMNVGSTMVARGVAWACVQRRDGSGVRGLEAIARSAGRGLWSTTNPVPPWTWRNRIHRGVPYNGDVPFELVPLGENSANDECPNGLCPLRR